MNPPRPQPEVDPADPATWFTTRTVDVGLSGTPELVAINVMREARYAVTVRRELLLHGGTWFGCGVA